MTSLRETSSRPTRLSTTLPTQLQGAIASLLEERRRRDLAERAARISAKFRDRGSTAEAILDEDDALAYALFRLPATYAATMDVLSRIAERAPSFRPRRVLDLGAGLGVASWAAAQAWPDIGSIVMLDRSLEFRTLALRFATAGPPPLAGAQIVAGDMGDPPDLGEPFDLVAVSYALTEIPEGRIPAVLDAAWRICRGMLVIVEPGTPRDFERLARVRARLTQEGASIALPCPHSGPCPIIAPDWCHFSVRLSRSRDHKLVKGAAAPFEDEKFAYLAAAREGAPIAPAANRVLTRPETLKYAVRLRLCTSRGVEETLFLKRDRQRFDAIRKKAWGDDVDAPEETTARD
jgi:ribosomal protein RSM22 (predicted rRNA methylase)